VLDAKAGQQASGGNPAPQPNAEPAAPAAKLLGRYDLTPDGLGQADAWLRQQQSEKQAAQNALARYQKYDQLIEEIENDPAVTQGVIDVLRNRGQVPSANSGAGAATPPEISVELETDEFGTPTGKAKVDPAQFAALVDQRAREVAAEQTSSSLQASEQKRSMAEAVKSFGDRHKELTPEEISGMLQKVRELPPDQAMELIYNGAKTQMFGENSELAAEQRGQDQLFNQLERAQSMGPAVGALPGGGEKAQPNLQQQLMNELKEADRAENPTGLFDE
jgi:hypothetical protein